MTTRTGLAQNFPENAPGQSPIANTAASGCGYASSNIPTRLPELIAQSGTQELDENVEVERRVLSDFFNVSPNFGFFDDYNQMDALAIPSDDKTTVILGLSLIRSEINRNPDGWQSAIIGIMAHEWAHALQYYSGLQELRFLWETHADYLAGWYLGTKRTLGLLNVNPEYFAQSLYIRGSNIGYFDPDNYGSPQTRVRAMLAGFEFGESDARKYGRPNVYEAANRGYKTVQTLK